VEVRIKKLVQAARADRAWHPAARKQYAIETFF
jgi:hypothetical protein